MLLHVQIKFFFVAFKMYMNTLYRCVRVEAQHAFNCSFVVEEGGGGGEEKKKKNDDNNNNIQSLNRKRKKRDPY